MRYDTPSGLNLHGFYIYNHLTPSGSFRQYGGQRNCLGAFAWAGTRLDGQGQVSV